MKIIAYVFFGLVGFILGCLGKNVYYEQQIRDIQDVAYEYYEHRLADPHHCLSVCVEHFEKFGC